MALLYETAIWRAIVAATRDPKILAAFTVATGTAAYGFAKGAQFFTSAASDQTKEEIEKKLRKDAEAARYASHSKNALAVMLDNFNPESKSKESDPNDKYKKNPIKLPGVMWHPKVMEKDRTAAANAKAPKSSGAASASADSLQPSGKK